VYTRDFLVAALANLFFFLSLNCFNLLPLYIKHLGGTEAQIGFIMGMNSLATIVFQPLAGFGTDRFGPKRFLYLGGAIAMLGTTGFLVTAALNTAFPVLRFIHGVGFSCAFTANFTLIAGMAPAARRAEAMGVYGTMGLFSMALAPAAGELVIAHYGYPAFFATALALGAGSLLTITRVPDIRPAGAGETAAPFRVATVLRGRRVRTVLAVGAMFGLAIGTTFAFVPTYAKSVGIERVRWFYIAYTVAAVAVRLLGGRVMDTMGPRRIIPPNMVLQGAGMVALVFLGSAFTLGLAGFLAGLAHGFLYPAFSVLIVDLAAAGHRGKMVGIFSSIMGLGASLGALTLGVVAQAWGYPAIFLITCLASLVGCALFVLRW
jgi:MFS family permease